MMHQHEMQRDGERDNAGYSTNPSPGTGNRVTDAQDSGERGFFNEWDGGGAGGAHGRGESGNGEAQGTGGRSTANSQHGAHKGRGPKGYQRSDARIAEDVHNRLTDDHMLDASEIEVSVENGEVTLSGSVESRGDRRRAEMLLDDIVGIGDVHNRIKASKTA